MTSLPMQVVTNLDTSCLGWRPIQFKVYFRLQIPPRGDPDVSQMLLNLSTAGPELGIDCQRLPDEVVEHHMSDVRLRDGKVAVNDAQLGAVIERLAVEAQLIQEAPDGWKKRHLCNKTVVQSQLTLIF